MDLAGNETKSSSNMLQYFILLTRQYFIWGLISADTSTAFLIYNLKLQSSMLSYLLHYT